MPFKTTYATAAATYDNYIRDTVKFTYPIQTIYKDHNDNYIAILKDGTELDVTQRLSNAGHTLIEDSEGNQMAVTGEHRLMSAEQYHKTGKNSTLINDENNKKDRQISTGEVIFKQSATLQSGLSGEPFPPEKSFRQKKRQAMLKILPNQLSLKRDNQQRLHYFSNV